MIEKPDYQVLLKEGRFELRHYSRFAIARIRMERTGEMDRGFQEMFRYIQGANADNRKISMTSPVMTTVEEDAMTMAFVMPRAIAPDRLPAADDSRIRHIVVESGRFAAIRFSGSWEKRRFDQMTRQLEAWIKKQGWETEGEVIIARYNPPFMPAFLRRNEILIRIVKEGEL